jgi:hypothetical protein
LGKLTAIQRLLVVLKREANENVVLDSRGHIREELCTKSGGRNVCRSRWSEVVHSGSRDRNGHDSTNKRRAVTRLNVGVHRP